MSPHFKYEKEERGGGEEGRGGGRKKGKKKKIRTFRKYPQFSTCNVRVELSDQEIKESEKGSLGFQVS